MNRTTKLLPAVKLAPLLCWCLIVSVPLSAWPQSRPDQRTAGEDQKEKLSETEGARKVKTQVQERGTGEKATLKVTLRDKSELKGYISKIEADSFQLTDKKSGQLTTIAYQQVDKIRKPGLSTGAKIAIGAGVAAGVLVAIALGSLAASGE